MTHIPFGFFRDTVGQIMYIALSVCAAVRPARTETRRSPAKSRPTTTKALFIRSPPINDAHATAQQAKCPPSNGCSFHCLEIERKRLLHTSFLQKGSVSRARHFDAILWSRSNFAQEGRLRTRLVTVLWFWRRKVLTRGLPIVAGIAGNWDRVGDCLLTLDKPRLRPLRTRGLRSDVGMTGIELGRSRVTRGGRVRPAIRTGLA